MASNLNSFLKMTWYRQVGIVVLVCAIGLGLLWYQYLSPMELEITAKEGQLATLQLEVAKSLKQKMVFEQFKIESIELAKRLDELKTILPLDRETPEIINTIRAEAAATAVQIIRINLRPFVDREVYRDWPWDMEVVGTYNSISAFFDRLRRLPRILNVGNLKVSSRATEGERSLVASVGATYTATTFIYFEESIATMAPPPKPAK